jgi:hypothetical protein
VLQILLLRTLLHHLLHLLSSYLVQTVKLIGDSVEFASFSEDCRFCRSLVQILRVHLLLLQHSSDLHRFPFIVLQLLVPLLLHSLLSSPRRSSSSLGAC